MDSPASTIVTISPPRAVPVTVALGVTQTLAWASSYYIAAIVADPIARELGISTNWFFAAVSLALVISGLIGPLVGRRIDLVGGRRVLGVSNLTLAAGLVLLGSATSVTVLVMAWLVLGIGMGLGLYDAAFGALGRIFGDKARRPITGITLFAGFASTVGWPLTSLGLDLVGWRYTCFGWAAAQLLIGLPLNLYFLPTVTRAPAAAGVSAMKPQIPIDRTMLLLAFAFAAAWTVAGAMGAHLPRILEAAGATRTEALAAGALFGPAQVGARLLEAGFLSRYHPIVSARIASIAHPIGAALFGLFGGAAAGVFAICHGAGNGIVTIARGTLPLAIYGPVNYGYRLGVLGAPSRVAQAAAPLAFGLMIERWGAGVLYVTSALSLLALLALLLVKERGRSG
ncbi:MFS transporter [Bradyrhizobium sp. WD16]|uniref:MFS transporter n=1 Tax=Bradyrhizobium sp. WD16 TaxID=1521768 RepID=UPI0020A3E67D|nr:MFS transporter [Bradyrhizobium sp. WD16]UTD26005.1 MFS transporter [Bradyrhizobium sp. WD16]